LAIIDLIVLTGGQRKRMSASTNASASRSRGNPASMAFAFNAASIVDGEETPTIVPVYPVFLKARHNDPPRSPTP